MNTYYEYIRWANESDHHPSQQYSFIIPDTIDKNTSFEIKFANRNTWANPFYNSSSLGFWGNVRSNGVLETNYFSQKASTSGINGGTIKYDKNRYYVNGNLVNTLSTVNTSTTGIIINRSEYGDDGNSLDIYYIKVWQNNVLTRSLVPCLNSSNEKGMYDVVSNTFFKDLKGTATLYNRMSNVTASGANGSVTGTGAYNSGTSISLNAVPNSGYRFRNWKLNGYTKLEYLESTGAQYIDTGFKPNQDTRINANIQALSLDGWMLGSRSDYNDRAFGIALNFNGDRTKDFWNYNASYVLVDQVFSTSEYVDIDLNKNILYKNGVQLSAMTYASFQTIYNAYLFNANLSGSLGTGSPSRWKWCKIYDNGTLIRDFVPVKRNSDNALGMLDLVNLKFYTNAGSGTFTAGSEIGELDWEAEANPLPLTVWNDLDFTAVFGIAYTVTLTYDHNLGSASYEWINYSQIRLTASPNQNAQFKAWYYDSAKLSDSATYVYTVPSNVTIEARFEEIYPITDSVVGYGAMQYTRGTDKNDVVFSVIPSSNYHFLKYVANGVEYYETPLSLHLNSALTITIYFERNVTFHVYTESNFSYGSFYVSDNDVVAGTVVTVWARPFPDYAFVRWSDGTTENPRQIEVNQDVNLVAEYQRVSDTENIYQYRAFVKDQLNLTDPPKAFLRVDTFDVRTDYLTNATSSITVLEIASNINEGDILVLYDPKGQFLYNGVINSIEDKTIGCSQMQSFYKGNWVYSTSSQDYLEHEIAVVLKDYADGKLKNSSYVDPLVAQRLGGITIQYVGSTTVGLPSNYEGGDNDFEVVDMEEFIYSLYEKYGIVFSFQINMSGANYVTIKVPTFEKIKVGNNMFAIQNMLPITEIEETNKLVIYNANNIYRTTYIATRNGIVEQPSSTANRFNITNTEIVCSDDPVADLVASKLPSQMFNHKLEFDLIIKNFIYEFGDFNLGGELDIYYGDEYYDSVLTGYQISKASNQNITQAHFVCGKVRTALTKLLTMGRL